MSDIIRPLLVMGSPILAALAGSVLYSRSRSRGFRIFGLVLSLLIFAVLTAVYVTSSITHLQQSSAGFGDIIIALAAIVYAAAAPILLLPLSVKKLPLRLALFVPAGFGLLIAVLTQLLIHIGRSPTTQVLTGFLMLLAITAASTGLTWVCCLYRRAS